MYYPIAIEPGDATTAWGIQVPDLMGCFSAADTLEEVYEQAREAICLHLEGLAQQGYVPALPRPVSHWQPMAEYAGMGWALIEVDVTPYLGGASKINVSMPDLLTERVDQLILASPKWRSRSQFLQVAALQLLATERPEMPTIEDRDDGPFSV